MSDKDWYNSKFLCFYQTREIREIRETRDKRREMREGLVYIGKSMENTMFLKRKEKEKKKNKWKQIRKRNNKRI